MCLLYTFVKNYEGSEILPYLQVVSSPTILTHAGGRRQDSRTEKKDRLLLTAIAGARVPAFFSSFPCLQSPKGNANGPRWMPMDCIRGWKSGLRELKSFLLESKHACPLLPSITHIFPRLFTIQTSVER